MIGVFQLQGEISASIAVEVRLRIVPLSSSHLKHACRGIKLLHGTLELGSLEHLASSGRLVHDEPAFIVDALDCRCKPGYVVLVAQVPYLRVTFIGKFSLWSTLYILDSYLTF